MSDTHADSGTSWKFVMSTLFVFNFTPVNSGTSPYGTSRTR
jgi:hypothetical protein